LTLSKYIEGEVADSNEGMSELFSEAFGKVFTKERLDDVPTRPSGSVKINRVQG